MTSTDILEQLAPYVPAPVAQSIYRKPQVPTQPVSRQFPAVVLFSDISGFTTLSELLSKAGPTGAEELSHLVNKYFTEMIRISQAYHGQVVKFSGDALTVLFPADEVPISLAVRQAAECALSMQAKMTDFSTLTTSRGPASLSMKVGIGTGDILECHVGGAFGRWEYIVAGSPLVQVAVAEQQAKPGQIVCSPQTWEIAQLFFRGVKGQNHGGYVQVDHAIEPLPWLDSTELNWSQLTSKQIQAAEDALKCYVSGAVQSRLGGQIDWLADLRPMTTVFIGMGGLDYEASNAGERLHRFVQAVRELVHRFEGSLNKVVVDDKGTILLVLFGTPPFLHEDNATRAVAFALELQGVAQAQDLQLSIGITEGTAFAGPVGAPNRREYTVIGDVINLAARLMQHGSAGSIIISNKVKERAGPNFATESLGEISLKGIAQKRKVHLVKGQQEAQEEFVMRYLLQSGLLIGRQEELAQMQSVSKKAQTGQLQLLTIEGELGLGKSRLASEMIRTWVSAGGVSYGGRSISYNRQIPYRMWREVLSAIYGLTPSLSPQRQLARLAAGIANLEDPPDQPDYWANRLPLLADVLGLDAPENEFTQSISGELRRNNTFALIETLLRREAGRRPMLILLEDAHWADELSLALVTHLAKNMADISLLLVLVHRPLTLAKTAALAEATAMPCAHAIRLTPLSAEDSEALIESLLDDKRLPARIKNRLLDWGQGNPFFLQEIANAIQNILANKSGTSTDLFDSLDLPDSVHDVILSRVDQLAEDEKLTLKTAAVIGTRFQRSLLSSVHPAHYSDTVLSSQLNRLELERLVRLIVPGPQWEYNFFNGIVQEVVYEGLLLAQRRQLHESVGMALETLIPDEVEQLAYHFSNTNNWKKALHYLKAAAEKTRREYANNAAIGYYSQILELQAAHVAGGIMSADYWDTLLERARLYNLVGERDEELEDLGTLGLLAEALNDDYRRALSASQWAWFYEASGDYDSGVELIERCVTYANQAGAERLVGEGYNRWGKMLSMSGDYNTAYDYLQRALLITQNYNDQRTQADCLNSLGLVAHYQTEYDAALYFFEEAIALWRHLGDQSGLGRSLNNIGRVFYDVGSYSLALKQFDEALILYNTIGDRAGIALAQLNMGQVRHSLGDYITAKNLLEEALDTYRQLEDNRHIAYSLYHLAFLYCRLAEQDNVMAYFEEAITILQDSNNTWALGRALTYFGWCLTDLGHYQQARLIFEEALKAEQGVWQTINRMEDIAHLGRVALAIKDTSLAITCARHALDFINQRGTKGIAHPGRLYLSCYRILQGVGKQEKAQQVLVTANNYLAQQAAQIEDTALQHSYLHNVVEHQTLQDLL